MFYEHLTDEEYLPSEKDKDIWNAYWVKHFQ